MTKIAMVLLGALVLLGCNGQDRDAQPADTVNSQPVDQHPKIDRNPAAQTTTGGDQQGTQPAQPANP